jgi:hypothetical protein
MKGKLADVPQGNMHEVTLDAWPGPRRGRTRAVSNVGPNEGFHGPDKSGIIRRNIADFVRQSPGATSKRLHPKRPLTDTAGDLVASPLNPPAKKQRLDYEGGRVVTDAAAIPDSTEAKSTEAEVREAELPPSSLLAYTSRLSGSAYAYRTYRGNTA